MVHCTVHDDDPLQGLDGTQQLHFDYLTGPSDFQFKNRTDAPLHQHEAALYFEQIKWQEPVLPAQQKGR
jgi:hypothetical protein